MGYCPAYRARHKNVRFCSTLKRDAEPSLPGEARLGVPVNRARLSCMNRMLPGPRGVLGRAIPCSAGLSTGIEAAGRSSAADSMIFGSGGSARPTANRFRSSEGAVCRDVVGEWGPTGRTNETPTLIDQAAPGEPEDCSQPARKQRASRDVRESGGTDGARVTALARGPHRLHRVPSCLGLDGFRSPSTHAPRPGPGTRGSVEEGIQRGSGDVFVVGRRTVLADLEPDLRVR